MIRRVAIVYYGRAGDVLSSLTMWRKSEDDPSPAEILMHAPNTAVVADIIAKQRSLQTVAVSRVVVGA